MTAAFEGAARSLPFLRTGIRHANRRITDTAGGPARLRVILLLGATLGLSGADVGAIGALAPQLESAFRVGNAGIGLLVTVSSLVGAAATLPVGVLVDRFNRTRLLSASIVVWGVTELLSGLATSWALLILARVALGAVTATAGPTVASLTGDLFKSKERSRIYGFILTGELIGAGLGVVVAGDLGAATSWRLGLAVLAIPSLLLAWVIHRRFPEPARGGQSHLAEGAEEILSQEVPSGDALPASYEVEERDPTTDTNPVLARLDDPEAHVEESRVLTDADVSVWRAVRWVLRVPTNVSLIFSSALGYFFLSGLRTFALIYARGRFGIGQGLATLFFLLIGLAAVAGVIASGRTTDRLIDRGRLDARLLTSGGAFLVAAVVLVPALLSGSVLVALPLFLIAGFVLSAPNPPIDAARLDVVPSRLWGRAEAVRTFVRVVLEAVAPLLFGLLSATLGGGAAGGLGSGINAKSAPVSHASATGIEYTFLLMLVALAASGLLLLRARRHYLTDVATAAASEPRRGSMHSDVEDPAPR